MKKSNQKIAAILFALLAALPLLGGAVGIQEAVIRAFVPLFILTVLGFGNHLVTGKAKVLNLGCAGFMAIGAYTYSILTADIYPFQLSFLTALSIAALTGLGIGSLIGLPTLRLKGDYLAIVTLGFGEIIQDVLKNLSGITKGTQGINPVPSPALFQMGSGLGWYYSLLGALIAFYLILEAVDRSLLGKKIIAAASDELASRCSQIPALGIKVSLFAAGSGVAAISGALWAAYLGTSGEPGNYDFQISILALAIIIIGGLGNPLGVIVGGIVMVGINSIVLTNLFAFLTKHHLIESNSAFSSPGSWKYMLFGVALVLMMRLRPRGIISSAETD